MEELDNDETAEVLDQFLSLDSDDLQRLAQQMQLQFDNQLFEHKLQDDHGLGIIDSNTNEGDMWQDEEGSGLGSISAKEMESIQREHLSYMPGLSAAVASSSNDDPPPHSFTSLNSFYDTGGSSYNGTHEYRTIMSHNSSISSSSSSSRAQNNKEYGVVNGDRKWSSEERSARYGSSGSSSINPPGIKYHQQQQQQQQLLKQKGDSSPPPYMPGGILLDQDSAAQARTGTKRVKRKSPLSSQPPPRHHRPAVPDQAASSWQQLITQSSNNQGSSSRTLNDSVTGDLKVRRAGQWKEGTVAEIMGNLLDATNENDTRGESQQTALRPTAAQLMASTIWRCQYRYPEGKVCNRVFPRLSNLRLHRRCHGIKESGDDMGMTLSARLSQKKLYYHCPHPGCKYETVRTIYGVYGQIREHYRRHGAKIYPCGKCGKMFALRKDVSVRT